MMIKQPKQMWTAVLGQLQLQVTRPSYETWLKDTVGVSYTGDEFVVGTPNPFVAEMLEHRMYSLISQAMERVTKNPTEVCFQVLARGDASGDSIETISDSLIENLATPSRPTPYSANLGGQVLTPQGYRTTPLNPRYKFDSFIVGKSNELAHAAATAVSEKPGVIYNPLVIYSDVGLGKTHLLHAIGHLVQSRDRSMIYVTTEEFTNQYIKAIREGKTEEFRNLFRSVDVLLLDDIQFLIGKEQTQEGFFHTFNALHMANRQVVITSDRPVTTLTLLENRIRSRLSGGLVVDIQMPDLETRLAILRAKADLITKDMAPEVVQYLGERIHRNIRELEGCLNRIVAYAHLTRSSITLDLAKRFLADILSPSERRQVQPGTILREVASYFRIDESALKGPRGKKMVSLARQVAMYLLREDSGLGPTAIGRMMGGKDHSTVLKNCAKITTLIDVDSHLRRDVLNIRNVLLTETSRN